MTSMQKQETRLAYLSRVEQTINEKLQLTLQSPSLGLLAYWLANLSELVNVLGRDRDLSSISSQLRIRLAGSLEDIFYRLIDCVDNELQTYRSSLIDPLQEKTLKSCEQSRSYHR